MESLASVTRRCFPSLVSMITPFSVFSMFSIARVSSGGNRLVRISVEINTYAIPAIMMMPTPIVATFILIFKNGKTNTIVITIPAAIAIIPASDLEAYKVISNSKEATAPNMRRITPLPLMML